MENLLNRVFFIEVPGNPGFQLALVVATYENAIYRCRLLIEGEPIYFFLEEAELLPLKPQPLETFDRIDWVPIDEQNKALEQTKLK